MTMIKVFGIEHFSYLIVVFSSLSILMFILKKSIKTDKQIRIMFMILGIIDIISVMVNRVTLVYRHNNWFYIIPDSFCGLSGLMVGISLTFFKKDNYILHTFWLLGLVGVSITHIYPEFIEEGDSLFYPTTITSFWHHSVTLFNLISVFLFKYIHITYKKSLGQLGIIPMYLLGLFLVYVGNVKEAFFIAVPAIKGTFLYFHTMLPIYLTVYLLVLILIEYVRVKHNANELEFKKA